MNAWMKIDQTGKIGFNDNKASSERKQKILNNENRMRNKNWHLYWFLTRGLQIMNFQDS